MLVYLLVVTVTEPSGLYVAAGVLAALFIGAAAHGWVQHGREQPVFDEDDETDLEDLA